MEKKIKTAARRGFHPHEWIILLTVMIASFLGRLDGTVVNLALPKMISDFGITVSVAPGAGAAVIADNLISDVRSGAIIGMEWKKPVTGDLAKDGATRYAQLSIGGNRAR